MKNRRRTSASTSSGSPPSLAYVLGVVVASVLAQSAQAAEGLTLAPDPRTLIILVVVFLVLIAPVNLLLFRPVFRVLEARREQIEGATKRAERLSEEADAAVTRYERAVREVRESAERERRQRLEEARREQVSTVAAARAEAERQIEGARSQVATALEEARGALRAQAEDLAREVAQRMLGRPLS